MSGTIDKADEIAMLAGTLERAQKNFNRGLISSDELEAVKNRVYLALAEMKKS